MTRFIDWAMRSGGLFMLGIAGLVLLMLALSGCVGPASLGDVSEWHSVDVEEVRGCRYLVHRDAGAVRKTMSKVRCLTMQASAYRSE